jgi:RNA polymerase sigma factor (sigma-70 family)
LPKRAGTTKYLNNALSLTDADLIARVLSQEDPNAFCELVRRYQSPVRGFLVRMTQGDSHLADDLAQETFLKAWQKLRSFRGEARFSTWLFGIAVNEFRNACRRHKNFGWEESEQSAEEPSVPIDPHLTMDLTEAMKLLTPAERAAIILCCQNGLSHEEAAQALDRPLGTVKTNILRGKEKLRRRLALSYQNYEPA